MPEKLATVGQAGGFGFEKPEELPLMKQIGLFIYNKKTGQFFTRTPLSWFKIITFLCIFYSALSCLFCGCMYMLLRSLDFVSPRWQLEESRIGVNPGLGYRPMNPHLENHFSLLIVNTQFGTQKPLIEQLDEFLEPYRHPLGPQYEVCDYERSPINRSMASCSLEVDEWEPCTKRSGYGYDAAQPCVFLKLNKIFGWMPEYYTNASELPENMPDELKQHIMDVENKDPKMLGAVWLSCDGENAADRQNLGPVQYIPERGFPGYFYPFINTPGYLSPLVAVHFQRPEVGVIINIECRVWAKNIVIDSRENIGSIKFQLFVE